MNMTSNREIFKNGLLPKVFEEIDKEDHIKKERMLLFYTFLGGYHSIYTIRSYKQDIALFYKKLHSFWPKLHEYEVEEEHALVIINNLKECGLSDRRIARLISCLTAFYDFLLRKKKIQNSPFRFISQPNISKDILTQALDEDDFCKIMEYSDAIYPTNPRVAILFKLYFSIGYRNREIASVKRSDVEIVGDKVFILFKTKGNKNQKILIASALSNMLLEFISKGKFKEDEYIFAYRDRNKPPSQSNICDIFKRAKKKIGIKSEKFSPHCARATVITYLLRVEPIQNVSRFVTHANIEITSRYDKNRLLNEQSVAYQEYLNNLRH